MAEKFIKGLTAFKNLMRKLVQVDPAKVDEVIAAARAKRKKRRKSK